MLGVQGRFGIAMMPEAKKELKLTKDQEKKMQEAVKELDASTHGGALPSGFDLMNPMSALDPKIDEILDETQKKRMEEMFLWVNGGYALLDARSAAALELTDEQKTAAKEIDAERRKEMMDSLRAGASGYKAIKKKTEECGVKLFALLTPDQVKKFDELKGKQFKFRK